MLVCVSGRMSVWSVFGHAMRVWVRVWTWGVYCACLHVCRVTVCICVCVTWRVCDHDSDPLLVFWWARWVMAAVAEEAEVDEREEQEVKLERERGKRQLFMKGRRRRRQRGTKMRISNPRWEWEIRERLRGKGEGGVIAEGEQLSNWEY